MAPGPSDKKCIRCKIPYPNNELTKEEVCVECVGKPKGWPQGAQSSGKHSGTEAPKSKKRGSKANAAKGRAECIRRFGRDDDDGGDGDADGRDAQAA